MIAVRILALSIMAAMLAACSSTYAAAGPVSPFADKQSESAHNADEHQDDEPRPYDNAADAQAEVEDALAAASENGKMTIVAMGANWCHDSRGLAAQFEKERFQTLLSENYELVYVDVGEKDRNIDIAQGFGVEDIVGTPTVFVVSSGGNVLNLETAPTWRNAASRSEDDVYGYFKKFTLLSDAD